MTMTTGMVLEKQLRVLHLDLQAEGESLWAWNEFFEVPKSWDILPPTRTHLFILANSATPW